MNIIIEGVYKDIYITRQRQGRIGWGIVVEFMNPLSQESEDVRSEVLLESILFNNKRTPEKYFTELIKQYKINNNKSLSIIMVAKDTGESYAINSKENLQEYDLSKEYYFTVDTSWFKREMLRIPSEIPIYILQYASFILSAVVSAGLVVKLLPFITNGTEEQYTYLFLPFFILFLILTLNVNDFIITKYIEKDLKKFNLPQPIA